jgi:hypothetical protein
VTLYRLISEVTVGTSDAFRAVSMFASITRGGVVYISVKSTGALLQAEQVSTDVYTHQSSQECDEMRDLIGGL